MKPFRVLIGIIIDQFAGELSWIRFQEKRRLAATEAREDGVGSEEQGRNRGEAEKRREVEIKKWTQTMILSLHYLSLSLPFLHYLTS